MEYFKLRWLLVTSMCMLLILASSLTPPVTHASNMVMHFPPPLRSSDGLYNPVNLPNPPWWIDNNGKFSQCDSYQYQYGHIVNGQPVPGAGVPAVPLIPPPSKSPFRGVMPCGPIPGQNLGYEVQFYPGAIPEYEWQCTELVKRYLYQAFGAPDNKSYINGQQVVSAYTSSLLQPYLNNATPNQVPQAGDVLSFGTSDPNNAGHTAIVIDSSVDSSGNGELKIMDENNGNDLKGTGTLYVGNPHGKDSKNPVWHIDTQSHVDPVLSWLHPNTLVANPPVPSTYSNILNAVTSVAADNVWAVGYSQTTSGPEQTLIEQWNGTNWNIIPSPNLGTSVNELWGVAALSSNDIWAVGYYANSSGGYQTLLEHYDGNTWIAMTQGAGFLQAITRVSATEAWAVGYTQKSTEFTLHWINGSWQTVADPTVNVTLSAVSASSPTNVWAVGYNDLDQTIALHWTGGTKWILVLNSPNPGHTKSHFQGVVAINSSNVWIVGYSDSTSPQPDTAFAVQWTKSGWKPPIIFNNIGGFSVFSAITDLNANNIWAVGYYSFGAILIEHFNGASWSQITSPTGGGLGGISVNPTNGNVWMVGSVGNPTQTLTEFSN